MDGRGDHGESVAIIGIACRFPGVRDAAEFHDLAVAGRGMFQPAAALPGRPQARVDPADVQLIEGHVSVGTLASRPVADCVPRMRSAQEAGPSGPAPAAGAMSGAGAGNPARSEP